jgi:hypothetical protein
MATDLSERQTGKNTANPILVSENRAGNSAACDPLHSVGHGPGLTRNAGPLASEGPGRAPGAVKAAPSLGTARMTTSRKNSAMAKYHMMPGMIRVSYDDSGR